MKLTYKQISKKNTIYITAKNSNLPNDVEGTWYVIHKGSSDYYKTEYGDVVLNKSMESEDTPWVLEWHQTEMGEILKKLIPGWFAYKDRNKPKYYNMEFEVFDGLKYKPKKRKRVLEKPNILDIKYLSKKKLKTGRWNEKEIEQFESQYLKFENNWSKYEIPTRTVQQVRSHAQKILKKKIKIIRRNAEKILDNKNLDEKDKEAVTQIKIAASNLLFMRDSQNIG